MTCLLSTTYFGPVQWYQKLFRHGRVLIDAHESYTKQTYRNRCVIATTQGMQALTVPVVGSGGGRQTAQMLVSDHGNWRHLHWQALQTAYGESPFFEFYEDDLRHIFTEHAHERLFDLNEDTRLTVCRLLDISPCVETTQTFIHPAAVGHDTSLADCTDWRDAIRPRRPAADPDFTPRPYYQVYAQKHGFLPNLSILDLLFNMGPESVFYL